MLTWGLDPRNGVRTLADTCVASRHTKHPCRQSTADAMQADDSTNFTAVWVFNPSEKKLDVFPEFEVVPDSNSADGGFTLEPPAAGYKSAVWSTQFEPDTWVRKDDPRHKELKAQGLKH